MKNTLVLTIIFLSAISMFYACSDFYSYEPIKIELLSLDNGDTLKKNTDVYFNIVADDQTSSPQALTVDLLNSSNKVLASNTMTSPEVNKEIVLSSLITDALNLPYGQYTLAFTLKTNEEILYQKQWVFFYLNDEYKIKGVWSYPWVIEPKDKALLIADLKISPYLNPYIRWSQNNVVFAKGLLSDGFDQILWETPVKEGVYSITVEYFPFPPSGPKDYDFNSKTAMTAQLYVSSPQKNGVQSSKDKNVFYNLFNIYLRTKEQTDRLTSALSQMQVKNPKIVLNGDMIGFQLDGKSGFICNDMIIPIKNNQIQSFNLSLGFTLQAEQAGKTVFYIYSDNGSFSLRYFLNDSQSPTVEISANGVNLSVPSGITGLKIGERNVIDCAMIIKGETLTTVWKLNGTTVVTVKNAFNPKSINNSGVSIIGGNNSCSGIIDMLDIVLLGENEISSLATAQEPMLARRLK